MRAERKALKEENRITVLRNAVQKGIDSRRVENFDPKKQLEAFKSGKKNDPICQVTTALKRIRNHRKK